MLQTHQHGARVLRVSPMARSAHPEDDEHKWKGHGPRPVGPWPLARRVHELCLLVVVALLWCLAATNLFMSDIVAKPTAAPALVPFERPHRPDAVAGGALSSARDAGEPQPEPQSSHRSRSGQRRSTRRDLRALQRLLRRSAGVLSDTQRAKYAATLHSALRRYAASGCSAE
jgi:hypothetical protein